MEIHQVHEEKDKHQLSILDMKACVLILNIPQFQDNK